MKKVSKIFFFFVAPLGLLFLANIFIDIENLQIWCGVLVMFSIVQGMVTAESKKINRRIDLLLKIMNQENEQNSTQ